MEGTIHEDYGLDYVELGFLKIIFSSSPLTTRPHTTDHRAPETFEKQ